MAAILLVCYSAPSLLRDPYPISIQPIYLVWFNAEDILLFLKQDPEVAHLAAVYLRWASMGLPGTVIRLTSKQAVNDIMTPNSICLQLYQPVCLILLSHIGHP